MFTIIIPCHNYGKFLINCIESIEFKNKYLEEVMIINDNSNDETLEIIKSIKKKNKIKTFNVKFNSLTKTINFAVSKIQTSYFSRIDPDDQFHPQFFNNIIKNYINKGFDLVYGDLINKKKNKFKYVNQYKDKYFKYFSHPLSNGTLIKKNKFQEIGGLNEKLHFKDDFDMWLKLINSKSTIKYVNSPTFIYNRHDNNMSNNIIKKKITYFNLLIKNFL